MKQLLCALLLGLGLFMLHAPRAEAHPPGYALVVHEGKVVRKFRPDLPRWLHRHDDFRRWYVHGPHYRLRHPDWHTLYRLYLRDAAWHRHARGHRHGRDRHEHRHRRRH